MEINLSFARIDLLIGDGSVTFASFTETTKRILEKRLSLHDTKIEKIGLVVEGKLIIPAEIDPRLFFLKSFTHLKSSSVKESIGSELFILLRREGKNINIYVSFDPVLGQIRIKLDINNLPGIEIDKNDVEIIFNYTKTFLESELLQILGVGNG